MNTMIDDIYKCIADNIFNNISASTWDKAEINAQVFDGAVKLKGGSYDGNQFLSFKFRNFDRRITDDFSKLHKITTDNDSNLWNRAKFTLTSDGSFSIDFSWDQELADEIERLS